MIAQLNVMKSNVNRGPTKIMINKHEVGKGLEIKMPKYMTNP